MKLLEDLFDDVVPIELPVAEVSPEIEIPVEQPTKEGPIPGPDAGITKLLIDAIKDEWEAIMGYNDILTTAQTESGMEKVVEIINDINSEENNHVGMLQELLKSFSPVTTNIASGEEEASKDENNA